jgi:hypothetical protein
LLKIRNVEMYEFSTGIEVLVVYTLVFRKKPCFFLVFGACGLAFHAVLRTKLRRGIRNTKERD